MAYNEHLGDRVRRVFEEKKIHNIEEKKMMGGLTFMVNAYPNNKIVENAAKTYPVKVAFGFKGGLFVNNSNTKYLFGERKTKSITKPIFGLILAFDITNSVKFYTGINYFKRILIASEVLNTTQLPIFTFSTTNLEIPFEFHFELNKMKRAYIPEIIGGMTLVIPSNPLSDGQYSVTNYYKNKFINASYCVGGGIKKILKDKASAGLYLKLTFDNENPIGIGRIYSTRLEASLNYVFPSSKK